LVNRFHLNLWIKK